LLSGYSLSLLKNTQGGGLESAEPTQMGKFVARHYAGFGPTQNSLFQMDALRVAAAEDSSAVEQAFVSQLAQADVDPASSFTMTRTFDPDTQRYHVNVDHDFAKWSQVEDVLNNNPALFNDIQRVWEQQTTLASMRIVEGTLQEGAEGGQSAIDQAWLDHGSNDLAQSQSLSDTMDYRVGQIVSPSMAVADRIRGEVEIDGDFYQKRIAPCPPMHNHAHSRRETRWKRPKNTGNLPMLRHPLGMGC